MFKDLGKVVYTNELVKSKREISAIVIHCSVTVQGHYFNAKDIHDWHQARTYTDSKGKVRNWSGIGYHYVLGLAGEIEIGRDIDRTGAHVGGHNTNTIGICLIGGLGEDKEPKENSFTKDQFQVLDDMLRKLMCMYPKAKILGHRDFKGVVKKCPCMEVSEFIKGMEC